MRLRSVMSFRKFSVAGRPSHSVLTALISSHLIVPSFGDNAERIDAGQSLPGGSTLVSLGDGRRIFGVNQLLERPIEQFFPRVAEYGRGPGIREFQPPVLRDQDHLVGVFDHLAVFLFRGAKGSLGSLLHG